MSGSGLFLMGLMLVWFQFYAACCTWIEDRRADKAQYQALGIEYVLTDMDKIAQAIVGENI